MKTHRHVLIPHPPILSIEYLPYKTTDIAAATQFLQNNMTLRHNKNWLLSPSASYEASPIDVSELSDTNCCSTYDELMCTNENIQYYVRLKTNHISNVGHRWLVCRYCKARPKQRHFIYAKQAPTQWSKDKCVLLSHTRLCHGQLCKGSITFVK